MGRIGQGLLSSFVLLLANSASAGVLDWLGGIFTPAIDPSTGVVGTGAVIQLVLAVLGVASIIAKITPTEADNAIIDKILSVVHLLGLTKGG